MLNSDFIPFTVNQESTTEDSSIPVVVINAKNLAQKGTITIDKSGEIFSSISENDNVYQPIYSVTGLAGATYQVIATEDIITPDGTLRVAKGAVVDTITTGEDSKATTKPLYLGKYEILESDAPFGMALNKGIYEVELTYAGQNVETTTISASFYNERQKIELDLTKILELDKDYGIGTNNEILDITFGLYADKDITANDGKAIPKDGLIEIVKVDKSGKASFITDLPFGAFYVSEISTNEAYQINNEKYTFEFSYIGQDVEIVEISVNEGESIKNNITRGSINGIKISEYNEPLENATIGIFKPDTIEFTEENAIMTVISQENGSFFFEDVPFGNWIIKELQEPNEKFILSDEQISVTINESEQVVEIELVNYYIRGNIILTKVDKDYPDNHLEGAEFAVYDEDGNFIANLEEQQNGVYRLDNLKYGKWFVRETKSPEAFVLDENIYEVNITENEKTYVIENEAGVGFANQAQEGSLRIKKTSSDGKLEGFTFIVEGSDYTGRYFKQAYITDENGEILIEELRIGKYTIYELANDVNEDYILPKAKEVTIKYNETTETSFHNKKPIKINTGDDSNITLWIIGLIGSSIGLGSIAIYKYYDKKQKKSKKNK